MQHLEMVQWESEGVQMHKQLESLTPSSLLFLSLRGTGSSLTALRYNQGESHHTQMSVAVYKINTGLQQGHPQGAKHTHLLQHTHILQRRQLGPCNIPVTVGIHSQTNRKMNQLYRLLKPGIFPILLLKIN